MKRKANQGGSGPNLGGIGLAFWPNSLKSIDFFVQHVTRLTMVHGTPWIYAFGVAVWDTCMLGS